MAEQSLYQSVEALNVSEETLYTLHNFGIADVNEFLKMSNYTMAELGLSEETILRLFREAMIIKDKKIPSIISISLDDVVLVDYKITEMYSSPKVWYLAVKTENDEQFWIANDGIHQEKYILYSFEDWLRDYRTKELIILPGSKYSLSNLIRRMNYYGLKSTTSLSDSVSWQELCTMVINWGLTTDHDELLKYQSLPVQNAYHQEVDYTIISENQQSLLKDLVKQTRLRFREISHIISQFTPVY